MQNRFTMWLEMRPLRQAIAGAIVQAVRTQIIYRHGCPDALITDNGTQFVSKLMAVLTSSCGISHRTTPAYTPQCNPVEWANRTIKTMIAQYVQRNHRRWDENLPALQFAFNHQVHPGLPEPRTGTNRTNSGRAKVRGAAGATRPHSPTANERLRACTPQHDPELPPPGTTI